MEHKEAGCQTPEGPILCINNCGFFGSATTMNMCSKCHKEMVLKQEQAKLAASSIDSIVNGSGSKSEREPVTAKDLVADTIQSKAILVAEPSAKDVAADMVQLKTISREPLEALLSNASDMAKAAVEVEPKVKAGPSRCGACKKRVGLMGFNCRCGGVFCASHRYSEKHECSFDYRSTGRDEIAKSNPVVKAEKLEKI